MGKVLVILGSYLPKPSANGVCIQQVAQSLISKGMSVDIIAAKTMGLESSEEIEGVNVFRVKGRYIKKLVEWCDKKPDNIQMFFLKKLLLILNKVKNIINYPVWPLASPVYAYRMYRKALILQNENAYDIVIAVYNPMESLLAGALLKKKHEELNLMLYFLDTLSGGITPKYLSRNWLEKRGMRWDKLLFNISDKILVMESHRKHYMDTKYKDFFEKIEIVDIPLLRKFQVNKESKVNKFNAKKVNLVYTGTLIKNLKNPIYMLETLTKMTSPKGYDFHIFGGGDCHEIIDSYKSKSKNVITTYGKVNIDVVQNALIEGDILINIGSLVDNQIPGKIFEYIATGKPIISFYRNDSEPSIPYLKKYPLSLLIKEDWENIEENVRRIDEFISTIGDKKVSFETVKELFYENTPDYTAQRIIETNNKQQFI